MRKIIWGALIAILPSCSSLGFIPTELQNEKMKNQSRISISCDGFKSWPDCYANARVACPTGYRIIDKQENWVMQARIIRVNCSM